MTTGRINQVAAISGDSPAHDPHGRAACHPPERAELLQYSCRRAPACQSAGRALRFLSSPSDRIPPAAQRFGRTELPDGVPASRNASVCAVAPTTGPPPRRGAQEQAVPQRSSLGDPLLHTQKRAHANNLASSTSFSSTPATGGRAPPPPGGGGSH